MYKGSTPLLLASVHQFNSQSFFLCHSFPDVAAYMLHNKIAWLSVRSAVMAWVSGAYISLWIRELLLCTTHAYTLSMQTQLSKLLALKQQRVQRLTDMNTEVEKMVRILYVYGLVATVFSSLSLLSSACQMRRCVFQVLLSTYILYMHTASFKGPNLNSSTFSRPQIMIKPLQSKINCWFGKATRHGAIPYFVLQWIIHLCTLLAFCKTSV